MWWWIWWITLMMNQLNQSMNQSGYIARCQTGKSRIHIIQFLILSQSSVFNRLQLSWEILHQDEVDAERLRVAHSAKKPLTSTFSNLLKGAWPCSSDRRQTEPQQWNQWSASVPLCQCQSWVPYSWRNQIDMAEAISQLQEGYQSCQKRQDDSLTWLDYWLNLRPFFALPDSRFQELKESCHFSQSVWLHEAKEQAAWFAIYNKTQAHGQ
jgi:hypothetical protein